MSTSRSDIIARSRDAHRWIGVFIGCLILFITITGTIATLNMQLLAYERPGLRTPAQEMPATWEGLDRIWRESMPEDTSGIASVNIDPLHLPNHPWAILYFGPDGAVHQVMADPVAGETLGQRTSQGGAEFLWRLHGNLWLGDPGRLAQGFIGILLGIMVVSGISLHRKLIAQLFTFRPVPSRNFWSSLHKLISVWTLPFQGGVALSGAMFGMTVLFVPLAVFFAKGDTGSAFSEIVGQRPATVEIVGEPIPLDEAWATALAALPGLDGGEGRLGISRIALRGVTTGAMVYQFRGAGQIDVHGYTGEVVNVTPPSDVLTERVSSALLEFHLAEYAGSLSLLLHFVLGCLSLVIPVSGILIWHRTKTAQGRNVEEVVRLARPMSAAIGFSMATIIGSLTVMLLSRVLPPSMPVIDLFFWVFYGVVGAGLALGMLIARPKRVWNLAALATGVLLVSLVMADVALSGLASTSIDWLGLWLMNLGCLVIGIGLLAHVFMSSERPGVAPAASSASAN